MSHDPHPRPPQEAQGRPAAAGGRAYLRSRLRLLGAVVVVLGALGLVLLAVEGLTGRDILGAHSEWVLMGAVAVALLLRYLWIRFNR